MAVLPRRRTHQAPLLTSRSLKWRRPWVYPKQERMLFNGSRYVVIEASTKTGKTTGCLIWLVEQACLKGRPGRNFWWVAPVYGQARIAYARFKNYTRGMRGFFHHNDSALTVELANGAVIQFRSAEKPDNLFGDDVWAAVLDEASRMRAESWHALRTTLSATKGQVRIIGNIKGTKNWYYALARKAQVMTAEWEAAVSSGQPMGTDPQMFYMKLTAWDAVDAGILDRDEVELAQRDLPLDVFNELYLAIPTEDGANPFGMRYLRAARMGALSLKPVVAWGIDIASTADWTVLIGLDDVGHMAAMHRFRKPWLETIIEIKRIVGQTPALLDATGVGKPVFEALTRGTISSTAFDPNEFFRGLPPKHRAAMVQEYYSFAASAGAGGRCPNLEGFVYTQAKKQGLMEGLALAIQSGMVRTWGGPGTKPDNLEEGVGILDVELAAFEFVHTRTGVRYSAPEGDTDDCVNALALAWERLRTRSLRASIGGTMQAIAF